MDSFKPSFLLSFIVFLIGYLIESEIYIYLSAAVFGLIYFYISLKKNGPLIHPIILYSFSISITSIANIIGVLSIGKDTEEIYLLYTDELYLYEASMIHYFGLILFVFGFDLASRVNWLPSISFRIKENRKDSYLFILNLMLLLIIVRGIIPGFLGAIRSVIIALPLFSAFYFVKKGIIKQVSKYVIYGGVLVIFLTVYSVLFSYLRSDMIRPVIFFVLAYLIGHGSFKVLFKIKLIPVYVFALIFVSYFSIFGIERDYIGYGTDRIETLVELKEEEEEVKGATPLSRATNFNQLTQVVKITNEEGFLNGETLEYLSYVFIPRFIWPGKPIIQGGAWFAEMIGLSRINEEGRYTNSINMTIPGELFLNFGYTGLIIGSFIIGVLLRIFWNSVSRWKDPDDVLSNLFAAYLLFLGIFTLGADIQIMVTILATYLIFLFLNRFIFKNA